MQCLHGSISLTKTSLAFARDLHTTWNGPFSADCAWFMQDIVVNHEGCFAALGHVESLPDLLFSTAPMIGGVSLSSFCWNFTTSLWHITTMAEAIIII